MGYMYLLRCSDGSYYAGSCRHLENRIQQHASGTGSEYTKSRLPVELVFVGEFESVREAYAFEKRVQGWSRRKREALIEGRYDDLPGLSRKVWPKLHELPPLVE